MIIIIGKKWKDVYGTIKDAGFSLRDLCSILT